MSLSVPPVPPGLSAASKLIDERRLPAADVRHNGHVPQQGRGQRYALAVQRRQDMTAPTRRAAEGPPRPNGAAQTRLRPTLSLSGLSPLPPVPKGVRLFINYIKSQLYAESTHTFLTKK